VPWYQGNSDDPEGKYSLQATCQQRSGHHHHDRRQVTAGRIVPVATVWPDRNGADQHQIATIDRIISGLTVFSSQGQLQDSASPTPDHFQAEGGHSAAASLVQPGPLANRGPCARGHSDVPQPPGSTSRPFCMVAPTLGTDRCRKPRRIALSVRRWCAHRVELQRCLNAVSLSGQPADGCMPLRLV